MHQHLKLLWQLATKLDQDDPGKCVDITRYRGMIGSLLYLTTSRPDIMFSTCLCARFQANPKESHLIAVKHILQIPEGYTQILEFGTLKVHVLT